jgi:hypothetical protein
VPKGNSTDEETGHDAAFLQAMAGGGASGQLQPKSQAAAVPGNSTGAIAEEDMPLHALSCNREMGVPVDDDELMSTSSLTCPGSIQPQVTFTPVQRLALFHSCVASMHIRTSVLLDNAVSLPCHQNNDVFVAQQTA